MNIRRMMRFDVEVIKTGLGVDSNIDKYHSSRNSLGFVCEVEDTVLGYLCCNVDGELNEIAEIQVAPEVRGQGVGAALIQRLAETIGRDGTIEALVPIDRSDLIGFLKACKFSVVNSYVNDKVLLRRGWRFRHAPSTNFRITKGLDNDEGN